MTNVKGFLSEVWREVHPTKGRVVWPTKNKVISSTWVVAISSFIFGLILWLFDSVFGNIISNLLFS